LIVIVEALILILIVVGVVLLARRGAKGRQSGQPGSDVIVYLILAIAMGTSVFSLTQLGEAAFPGDRFVFDPERQVASSLAGLVVALPITIWLWIRQYRRRQVHPAAAGWTTYLSLTEAAFTTALVVALVATFDALLTNGGAPPITDLVILLGVFVFHDVARRRTPPRSDSAELPRVIGSAIGLIPTAIGLGGLLYWVFSKFYGSFAPIAGGPELGTAIAFLIGGLPIWWYRWLLRWDSPPTPPRNAWTFLMATFGLVSAAGAVVSVTYQVLAYLLTDTPPAASHFDAIPLEASVGVVGLLIWAHHRRLLGRERNDPVRAYEYLSAAFGLAAAIASATTLVVTVFDQRDIVGRSSDIAIAAGVTLMAGVILWLRFWGRGQKAPREIEVASPPRKFYLLGAGLINALIGAGALIATFVFVFQAILGVGGDRETLKVSATLFVLCGGAAWHLLREYAAGRDMLESDQVITPFDVTIVCSHPGTIATLFPKEARTRVIYRGDDAGVIHEQMASEIVEAVGHKSSIVWVDADGFRIASLR
jgi:hypothetical protein